MMGATFTQTCQTCDDPYLFDLQYLGRFMMLLLSPLFLNNLIVEDVEISTLDIYVENISRCQLIYMGFWLFCDLNSFICCLLFFPKRKKRKRKRGNSFTRPYTCIHNIHLVNIQVICSVFFYLMLLFNTILLEKYFVKFIVELYTFLKSLCSSFIEGIE